jgi:hypothetical protein
MPFSYGNQSGKILTGQAQILVTAPTTNQQRAIRSLRIANSKSGSATIEFSLWYRDGSVDSIITESQLLPGQQAILGPDDLLVLDNTLATIVGKVVSGTKTLDYIASYGDLS